MPKIEDIIPSSKRYMKIPKGRGSAPLGQKKILAAIGISITILVAGIFGAYSLTRNYSFENLKQNALGEIEGGNYAAALVLYDKLREASAEDTEIEAQFEEVKKLIVAEENFLKARQFAESGGWFEVWVLLKESDALSNSHFKYQSEALELYQRAEEQTESLEKETLNKFSRLQQIAEVEKSKRKQAEQNRVQTESELENTRAQKQQTEEALQSAKSLLEESEVKIDEAQSRFEFEQNKVQALNQVAERERLEKFLNEFRVYVGMLDKGNEYLDLTLSEINQEKDITALIFISQGKVLFDEVNIKVRELRTKRTPAQYIEHVDKIIQATRLFSDSIKSLRIAVIYIEEQQNNDFSNQFYQGKSLKAEARVLLDQVKQFINSY